MILPPSARMFVFDPLMKSFQFNTDLTGQFASNAPSFSIAEVAEIKDRLEEITIAKMKKKLNCCTLRVPLIPLKKESLDLLMICYYGKCLVRGQRPVQEWEFLTKYFWEYMLREILLGQAYPSVKRANHKCII